MFAGLLILRLQLQRPAADAAIANGRRPGPVSGSMYMEIIGSTCKVAASNNTLRKPSDGTSIPPRIGEMNAPV